MLISCAIFIGSISKSYYPLTIISIIVVLGSINIYRSNENKNFGDTDLSYVDLLKVQVKMVEYLQKSDFKEQIYSPFLMFCVLDNPYDGFIDKKFANLGLQVNDSNNVYFLNVSNENLNGLDSLLANNKIVLLKRFEEKNAMIELYKKSDK